MAERKLFACVLLMAINNIDVVCVRTLYTHTHTYAFIHGLIHVCKFDFYFSDFISPAGVGGKTCHSIEVLCKL